MRGRGTGIFCGPPYLAASRTSASSRGVPLPFFELTGELVGCQGFARNGPSNSCSLKPSFFSF